MNNLDCKNNKTLAVPYLNQHFKVIKTGEVDIQAVENKWGDHTCGIACVNMIINYYSDDNNDLLYTLLHRCIANGGYLESIGWKHQGLSDLLTAYCIKSECALLKPEFQIFRSNIDNDILTIISVKRTFPVNDGRGGHLVLVTGYKEDGVHEWLHIHDPSDWGRSRKWFLFDRVMSSFTGRAILAYG